MTSIAKSPRPKRAESAWRIRFRHLVECTRDTSDGRHSGGCRSSIFRWHGSTRCGSTRTWRVAALRAALAGTSSRRRWVSCYSASIPIRTLAARHCVPGHHHCLIWSVRAVGMDAQHGMGLIVALTSVFWLMGGGLGLTIVPSALWGLP